MKKALAVLISIAVLMLLCACGAEDTERDEKKTSTKATQNTAKDPTQGITKPAVTEPTAGSDPIFTEPPRGEAAPPESLILQDLKDALQKRNEYATITGTETVKSLTKEGTYETTLAVTAETKYADWTYEVDLAYTRYDQGWIVDDIVWAEESYTLARFPDSAAMGAYIEEYLPTHEVYIEYFADDYLFPVMNAFVTCVKYSGSELDGSLSVSWHTERKGNFTTMFCPYHSYWEYDPAIDNWTLLSNDDPGSLGYHLYEDQRSYTDADNLDFTGSWDYHMEMYGANIPINMTISNYSKDEFDATIEWQVYDIMNREFIGTESAAGHFTFYEETNGILHYTDGNNNEVEISFGYDFAQISYENEYTRVWIKIEEKLPSLP